MRDSQTTCLILFWVPELHFNANTSGSLWSRKLYFRSYVPMLIPVEINLDSVFDHNVKKHNILMNYYSNIRDYI